MSASPFGGPAWADSFGSGANSFEIEFVRIGNPGNPPDANPNPAGAVPYEYRIGKYEISEQMIDKANALDGLGITKDARGPEENTILLFVLGVVMFVGSRVKKGAEFFQRRVLIVLSHLLICGHMLAIPARAGLVELNTKLIASGAADGDSFGDSVAINDSRAVIGAPGANGDAGYRSGAVYVFDIATGTELAKLGASDAAALDSFGSSVAISGDRLLVGAPGKREAGRSVGAAYLFDIATSTQLTKLTASDPDQSETFGGGVAISGSHAIVGAPLDSNVEHWLGAAYVFDVATGSQLKKVRPSDSQAGAQFGNSVAISGDLAIVGAVRDDAVGRDSGSAYLFDIPSGNQLAKFVANDAAPYDYFGRSVAIGGGTALIGAPSRRFEVPGSAYLFNTSTGKQLGKLTASDATAGDRFGRSVAINGNWALVGAPGGNSGAGSVYLFDLTTQRQLAILTASDGNSTHMFGDSVAFDGSGVLVGAPEASSSRFGSAYLFHYSAVPEPGSVILALLAILPFVLRRAPVLCHCDQSDMSFGKEAAHLRSGHSSQSSGCVTGGKLMRGVRLRFRLMHPAIVAYMWSGFASSEAAECIYHGKKWAHSSFGKSRCLFPFARLSFLGYYAKHGVFISLATIVFASCVVSPMSVQAEVIYSQRTPSEPVGAFSSNNTAMGQKVADNFLLDIAESTTVRSLRFTGGYVQRNPPPLTPPLDALPVDNFRVVFLGDNAGSPGGALAGGDFAVGAAVRRMPTNGRLLNGVEIPLEFSLDLGAGITLGPEREYWVSITNNPGPNYGWTWARAAGVFDQETAATFGDLVTGSWNIASNGGMWFELNDQNVPEPTTFASFLTALVSVLMNCRRVTPVRLQRIRAFHGSDSYSNRSREKYG